MNDTAKPTFDPYYKWLGIPPDQQPPTHYRLLGLQPFEGDPEVIRAAVMRQSAHLKTYQLGEYAALTQKLLNEVSAAKVCLLDPRRKAAYDARLREELDEREKASRLQPLPTAKPIAGPSAADELPADLPAPEGAVDPGLADLFTEIAHSARPSHPTAKQTAKQEASPRLPGEGQGVRAGKTPSLVARTGGGRGQRSPRAL